MPSHECSAHIPDYPPDEVFRVATLFETLPCGQKFELKPDAATDRFTAETLFCIHYAGAERIKGSITDYVAEERIAMEGAFRKGKAKLWTNFFEDEELGGTRIIYGFSIHPRLGFIAAGHALMPRFEGAVSTYAELHMQNTLAGLINYRHIDAY
jgi:hypothetical protein